MKRIQLPFLILGIISTLVWLGCLGDDDDDDNDDNNGNDTTIVDHSGGVDIIGTWKLVSIEPNPGLLPQSTITIKSDGTWSQIVVIELPVVGNITVTSKGTYHISGDKDTGKTTEIKMEPNLGGQPPAGSDFVTDESTVKRDGNKMIITDANGSVVTYQKQ